MDVGQEGNGWGLLCVVQVHRVQGCNSKHHTVGQPGRRGSDRVSSEEGRCEAVQDSLKQRLLSVRQTCKQCMQLQEHWLPHTAQGWERPEQLTSEFEEHRAAPHSHSRLLGARQDSHRSAGRGAVC